MLPTPEVGRNDSETIQNLMDTVIRLRKELEHLLQHLDDDNIPSLAGIKGDIKANHTAIMQNENMIQLLAVDVAGNSASITVQAGQIQSLVTSVNGNTASITLQAGQIESLVTGVNGVSSRVTQTENSITSLVSTTSGHGTRITQTEASITSLVSTVNGQSSSITQLSNEISLKVSQGDYTASVIVSMINGSSVTISADRINLNGITSMSGLALVASQLSIGSPTVNGTITIRDGIDIYSNGPNELRVTVPTSSSEGTFQVLANRLQHNFKNVLTETDEISIKNWVLSQNYASGNFATSNQGLSIQNYAGHLEIYQGSTFIGKLKYV